MGVYRALGLEHKYISDEQLLYDFIKKDAPHQAAITKVAQKAQKRIKAQPFSVNLTICADVEAWAAKRNQTEPFSFSAAVLDRSLFRSQTVAFFDSSIDFNAPICDAVHIH